MIKIYSRMFIRTFFIQALWNFERVQNMGFVFILKPFLDKVYLNEDKKKEALLRHTGYFSTHPYMACLIVAIIANMEKKIADSGENVKISDVNDVNDMKSCTAGTFAAMGDSFFGGTLRPTISFISIFMLIFFIKVLNSVFIYSILIPFVFIVIYNGFHIATRYWLMFVGFKVGKESSISILSNFKLMLNVVCYSGFIIALSALILYLSVFGFGRHVNDMFFGVKVYGIFVYGIIFLFSIVVSGKFGVVFLFYSVILICILMSYLGM